ncbi:pyridoxal phosphate-dependent aminotransferase [Mesorhizobium sp. Cs1299R1N3]|uniref:pyridoxal phosphate-dependent aminotransferase n=1 Tax=Mesorhizobium sp. Cs1299R1N3 TaxID=3015173 RepID=UPI00301D93A0
MEYKAGLSVDEVSDRAGGQAITKLSSNENPFGPSPMAIAAAQTTLAGAHMYPPRNDDKLCDTLTAFHGRGLTRDNFFAANSGVEVLSLAEDALIRRGERAVICTPCFGAYSQSLTNKAAEIDSVPLIEPGFTVDVDAVLAAIRPETRLVYLCNPNNPTGTWFGEDVLSQVLDGLPPHVTLIYDEVYYQFATEAGLPDAIRHVLDQRNILIVHSFSKAYGLAGMRIGYGIAPTHIAARIKKLKRSFHLGAPVMAAATAALQDTAHLDRTVTNNHAERRRLKAALAGAGLAVEPSQANFVMFRCPEGQDAESLTAALVARGIMVRPAFYLPQHVRVTVGTPRDNDRFLAAITNILES